MTGTNRKALYSGVALLFASAVTLAAGTHPHTHSDSGAHRHDSWVSPPPKYAQLNYDNWGDPAAAERGEKLYQQNCVVCHGENGMGNGPAASGLEHKPADLTNHFHIAPGNGDGYLFWRVTEGGVVEPFRSMKSAMPPFKGTLSEAERWEVLTYIHQEFHGGFPENSKRDATAHDGAGEHGHPPGKGH